MKFKYIVVLTLLLLVGCNKFDISNIKNFYGNWEVVDIKPYRSSLTSKEEMKEYIRKSVSITGNTFKNFSDYIVSDAIYKYKKIDNTFEEGVIDKSKSFYSSYYGYMSNRKFIDVYEVYSKEIKGPPYLMFEILNKDKILMLYDGWFVFLKRK